MSSRWPRILIIVGTAGLLFGAIDPLEGSVVIAAGAVLLAAGAWIGHTTEQRLLTWACVMILIGVGALFGLSALGGVGGSSGRSMWWLLLTTPYPVGWVLGLIGAFRSFRTGPRQHARA